MASASVLPCRSVSMHCRGPPWAWPRVVNRRVFRAGGGKAQVFKSGAGVTRKHTVTKARHIQSTPYCFAASQSLRFSVIKMTKMPRLWRWFIFVPLPEGWPCISCQS
ncbi:hypothetical protein CNECB9_4450004 [Cupriavidus necator]|uniref:Uncharacterized protein n=1 Tax=Cupriavidus necator TaxID=106590 RepID=A0A1K0JJZ0_CUPNE|nr:hypothetical protein CNECB9_4450004 [Cupriavidus necator]